MVAEQKPNVSEILSLIEDPRVEGRCSHDLVDMLVVAVCASLCGADTFVEITLWAQEKLDWLRGVLKLDNGIASHDTYGRLFAQLDANAFETSFRRWVGEVLPVLEPNTVVAIDGKTSRRSHGKGVRALHMVSAFAAQIGSVQCNAKLFAHAVRSHWAVENQLHWCLDVSFGDDQARARIGNAAENLIRLKRLTMNMIRLDPSRKGGIKARRLVASTSDQYREQLLGLQSV